jgi:hypothetical protein
LKFIKNLKIDLKLITGSLQFSGQFCIENSKSLVENCFDVIKEEIVVDTTKKYKDEFLLTYNHNSTLCFINDWTPPRCYYKMKMVGKEDHNNVHMNIEDGKNKNIQLYEGVPRQGRLSLKQIEYFSFHVSDPGV